jgi:hypothetical protein
MSKQNHLWTIFCLWNRQVKFTKISYIRTLLQVQLKQNCSFFSMFRLDMFHCYCSIKPDVFNISFIDTGWCNIIMGRKKPIHKMWNLGNLAHLSIWNLRPSSVGPGYWKFNMEICFNISNIAIKFCLNKTFYSGHS